MSETTTPGTAHVAPSAAPASASTASPVTVSPATPTQPRLRLWPGIVIVATQSLGVMLAKQFATGTIWLVYAMFMGPMIAAALFAVWLLFASRLPRRDRWLTLAAAAGIGGIAFLGFHSSMVVMSVIVFALPTIMMAWAIWLLVTPFLGWPARRVGLLLVV